MQKGLCQVRIYFLVFTLPYSSSSSSSPATTLTNANTYVRLRHLVIIVMCYWNLSKRLIIIEQGASYPNSIPLNEYVKICFKKPGQKVKHPLILFLHVWLSHCEQAERWNRRNKEKMKKLLLCMIFFVVIIISKI